MHWNCQVDHIGKMPLFSILQHCLKLLSSIIDLLRLPEDYLCSNNE